jgi:hypothetical protein
MNENANLISAGLNLVRRHKRYIVWFYLMNLLFAWWGAFAFGGAAHASLDHSLYADRLLHGFDAPALIEMFARPEFGPTQSVAAPAMVFAVLFFLVSLLFMPGVLLGYSSPTRITKAEFFAASGRNFWRFIRLFLVFAVIAGPCVGIVGGIVNAMVKTVDKTTPERPPFFLQMAGNLIVFLILTLLRIWFDLAQTDVVVRDQGQTRKSIGRGFRWMRQNLGRLLGAYVVVALLALIIFVAGIVFWNTVIPPASVGGAFLIAQFTLFLLLTMRFWQRAAAVAFYSRYVKEPVVVELPTSPVIFEPAPIIAVVPVIPEAPAEG